MNEIKKEELRIVLLGKTGVGKSSAGNLILGENMFKTACSADSETHICERAEKVINGRRVVVIDTPGFFDTDRSEEELKKEIISSLVECAPGPHVFILVMEVARYTKENQQAVQMLLEIFSSDVLQHTVLLFTNGDKLKIMTINEFINQSVPTDKKSKKQTLKELAERCGNQVHVIDNEYWNKNIETAQEMASIPADKTPWFKELAEQFYMAKAECEDDSEVVRTGEYHSNRYQLTQLMKSIRIILKGKKGQHYTNEALEEIGKAIKVEVENILKEIGVERETADKVEIKKKARERVRNKLGETLVGVAVGTLLGALLGVGVGFLCPVVLAARNIKSRWREVIHDNSAGNCSEIAFAVGETVVQGAAAVVGAALGAGAGLIIGAGHGGRSGYTVSETTDNPIRTAEKVSKDLTQQSKDAIKKCWNNSDTDPGYEYQPLNKDD